MARKNQALIEFENRLSPYSCVQSMPADSAYHSLFAATMPVRKGRGRHKLSRADIFTRMQWKSAYEGDVVGAKIMLDAILQNEESRLDEVPPVVEGPAPPSSAAEALLLLGILDVEPAAPTVSYRFSSWAFDAAVSRAELDDAELATKLPSPESQVSLEVREETRSVVLELLGKAREPGANRFRKGASGNPRGRPRKKDVAVPHPFLLETVSFSVGGKNKKMTKAEVLIRKLTKLAETDGKIRNLLTRHLEGVKVAYGSRLNRVSLEPIRG